MKYHIKLYEIYWNILSLQGCHTFACLGMATNIRDKYSIPPKVPALRLSKGCDGKGEVLLLQRGQSFRRSLPCEDLLKVAGCWLDLTVMGGEEFPKTNPVALEFNWTSLRQLSPFETFKKSTKTGHWATLKPSFEYLAHDVCPVRISQFKE